MATNKREAQAPDYLLNFDVEVNIPKPAQIIVRLMVMLNAPLRRGKLGVRILECLQSIGPILHPSVVALWDSAIPKLIHYLGSMYFYSLASSQCDDHLLISLPVVPAHMGEDSWDSSTWEDLALRLLSETIKVVNEEEFTISLATALSQQIPVRRHNSSSHYQKCNTHSSIQ